MGIHGGGPRRKGTETQNNTIISKYIRRGKGKKDPNWLFGTMLPAAACRGAGRRHNKHIKEDKNRGGALH